MRDWRKTAVRRDSIIDRQIENVGPTVESRVRVPLECGRVVFAPDYSAANAYQRLLANALSAYGFSIDFLQQYRRVLPLWRGLRDWPDAIFHLHWPEHYFKFGSKLRQQLRRGRFPIDLALAGWKHPIVVTAHNLKPHGLSARIDPLIKCTYKHARVVLAHSESAKNRIAELTGIEASKIRVIPHGDLTAALPVIPPREEARAILGLKNSEKYALVFGRVAPYKGIESFIDCWIRHKPQVVLLIVGPPIDPGYAQALVDHAGYDSNKIKLQLRDLSDSELALFLGAADCALFNYPEILTSGSAALARAAGLPVLLPERLSTVDLGEPCERVLRFAELNDQFLDLVEHAVALSSDFASAADWRYATRWSFVARQTGKAYRLAIEQV